MNASASGAGQPRQRISIDYPYALGDDGWNGIQRVSAALRTVAILSEPRFNGLRTDLNEHDYAPLLWLFADAVEAALADRVTPEDLA